MAGPIYQRPAALLAASLLLAASQACIFKYGSSPDSLAVGGGTTFSLQATGSGAQAAPGAQLGSRKGALGVSAPVTVVCGVTLQLGLHPVRPPLW